MRKLITFLMTFLVGSSLSYVNAEYSQIDFEAGYRRDNIRFGLDIPSCDPFLELNSRFKDIDIFQIGVSARSFVGCNFYVRGAASWGWIIDGDFEEELQFNIFDFSPFENNTLAFKTSDDNILDGRFVVDFNIAIGYPFFFCDCMASISPVIGYAFDEQNLCVERNDDISFSTFGGFVFPTSGSGECCCDKLISRWYGPFVGFDFDYNACDCWDIYAQVQYHFGHQKTKRHSHNGDFLEFFHHHDRTSRDAHGWSAKIGADYDFCNCWSAGFSLSWTHLRASERHRFCNDDSYLIGDYSPNDLGISYFENRYKTKNSWQSFCFNLKVGREF